MNYAVINGSIPSGTVTYTVDLTYPSTLGWTPKAAIILAANATAEETELAGGRMSVGFTDGTNQFAIGASSEDNFATTDAARAQSNSHVIRMITGGGAVIITASFNSWITDGIRLNVTALIGGFSSRRVRVILFGGDDLTALAGNGSLGTGTSAVDFTGLGEAASLVFAVANGNTVATSGTAGEACFSFGGGIPGGGQGVVGFGWADGAAASTGTAIIRDDSVAGQWLNGAESWRAVLGTHASGFSLTPSADAGSDIVGYLALAFDDLVYASVIDLPNSAAADWDVATTGMSPVGVLLMATALTASNTMDTDTEATAVCLAASDGTAEGCIAVRDDDGADPSDSAGYASDEFLYYDDPGGTLLYRMAGLVLTSTGWTVPQAGLVTVPAATRKALAIAIGPSSAAPTVESVTVADDTWTIVFSEAVTFGAGGNGGLSVSCSTGAVTLAYTSGDGTNTLIYTGSRDVYFGESALISYTQPGNGIEADDDGADLASFSNLAVTNSGALDSLTGNTSPVAASASTLQLTSALPTPDWTSDDEDVMTVSGSGLVTILQAAGGAATIADGAGTEEVEFLARTISWSVGTPSWTGSGVGATIDLLVTLTGYSDGVAVGTYPDVSPSVSIPVGVTFDGFTGTEPNYTATFTVTDADGPWTAVVNGAEEDLSPAGGLSIPIAAHHYRQLAGAG